MVRSRTSATLVLVSEGRTSAELIAEVGLDPDRRWDRGEVTGPSGHRHRYSGLRYGSGLGESATAAEHVQAVVTRMLPYRDRLRAIVGLGSEAQGQEHARRIAVLVQTGRQEVGMDFRTELLSSLVAMGCSLSLAVDFIPEWADDEALTVDETPS